MPEELDLKKILKDNPQVDVRQLQEGIELAEELREAGMPARGYRLPPPFARKRAEVVDSPSEDPRTIHLRQA
jgi:hypothetical protein